MGISRLALRSIWLAMIVLLALIVSAATCLLAASAASPVAVVLGASGAAFIAVLGLGVNILKLLLD
ncbi:hypothetical protein CFN78_25510 [Amycolatopsis antarctica]|uniref:Uncharacterized protein n=2 Tax=Amycolatopsis antarctica TaxID=1854586 RepID=A0A263CVX1_9PSEU|nr:hypothetical protein CFN78_25510 [Amycolatopsis antarctica]